MSDELRAVSLQAEKLDREHEILQTMQETPMTDDSAVEHIHLTLSQAKRVKRESTLLVRALARLRDNLQSEEDTR